MKLCGAASAAEKGSSCHNLAVLFSAIGFLFLDSPAMLLVGVAVSRLGLYIFDLSQVAISLSCPMLCVCVRARARTCVCVCVCAPVTAVLCSCMLTWDVLCSGRCCSS